MFYAHFVLAKKGPLARIWLAAHWDKKLTKAHVFETNIESSVEGILQPKVKMALRTSGHLLLGIVRIYSRKAKYLLADCNEAFIKIKMAFRPGVVDLPEENREAAVATITLPEVFHDFDSAMPEINIDVETPVTLNQSRAEDITLKEDYGSLSLMADDGFGDMGFDDPEVARDATNIDEGFDHASLLLGEDRSRDKTEDILQNATDQPGVASKTNMSLDAPLKDDGFGGAVGEGLLDGETGGLFEPAGLFDDAPLGHVPLESSSVDNLDDNQEPPPISTQHKDNSDDDDDGIYDTGPPSMGPPSVASSVGSIPPREALPENPIPSNPMPEGNEPVAVNAELVNSNIVGDGSGVGGSGGASSGDGGGGGGGTSTPPVPPPVEIPPPPPADQTTLIHNEEETFALAPLDATIIQGSEKTVKAKRKRKLIVDEVKNISGEEMKSQLSDTTDIVTTLDLAPPTKRLMHWKETGGVEKLFALPGHPILSKTLSKIYQRHLTTRSVENEEFGDENDRMDLNEEIERARDDDETFHPPKRRREMEIQDMTRIDHIHLDNSHLPNHGLSQSHLNLPAELMPPPPPMYVNMPSEEQQAPMPMMHDSMPQGMYQMPQSQPQHAHMPPMAHMPSMAHIVPPLSQQLPHTMMHPSQAMMHPPQQDLTLPQGLSSVSQVIPQSVISVPPVSQNVMPMPHPVPQMGPIQNLSLMPSHIMSSEASSVLQQEQEAVQPIPHVQEPAQPEPSHPEPPHSELPQPELSHPEIQQPVLQQLQLQEPELPQSELGHPEIPQELPQPEIQHPELPQSEPLQSEIHHLEQQAAIQQSELQHTELPQQELQSELQMDLSQSEHQQSKLQQPELEQSECQPELQQSELQSEKQHPEQQQSDQQQVEQQQSELQKLELSHSELPQSEIQQSEHKQSEHQHSELSKPELPQPELSEQENTHLESIQDEKTHPEPPQQESTVSAEMEQSTQEMQIEDQQNERLDSTEMNHKPQQYPMSDDDDDYTAPASVGPLQVDEQQADETYEQFEERILNKRTAHMLHIIHHRLNSDKEVHFSDLIRNNKRKQVAQKFYTFLVLKKQQAVELQQLEPYSELIITRGPKFTAIY